MTRLVTGLALELLAVAVFLVAEYFKLPFTLALFIHLCAVYLFTRALDGRLLEINLPRQLCFFFTLLFPLSGMIGVLFYIFVLKNIEEHIVLKPAAKHQPSLTSPCEKKNEIWEEDSVIALKDSFAFRLPYSLLFHDVLEVAPADNFTTYLLEKDLEELKEKLNSKVRIGKASLSSTSEKKELLAYITALLALAALSQTEPVFAKQYLTEALELWQANFKEQDLQDDELTVLAELYFLKGDFKACEKLYQQARKKDKFNLHLSLRVAEGFYRLKQYKKLKELLISFSELPACPEKIKELVSVWS